MKRFVFFIAVVLLSFPVYTLSACAPGDSKDGIQFFEGSWKDALNKARAEKKLVFVDIYATWCGPCKLLRRKTFTNKEVGAYFNANYVNVSLDGEKGDGAAIASQYRIPGYPTLMVFNADGKLVNMETGYMEPDDLLSFGRQAAGK